MIRKAYTITGWSLFALAAIVVIVVRFSNPELTETQLFTDFIMVWLCVVMAILTAVVLIGKGQP
ncbi:MAG: hypothetical protein IPK44_01230 [Candidatus Accumulibacter sp.]|uniref:hypothetical protein n=1 Tax=Accumulibacter sp. TaxID=2053492 RepID=UPI002590CA31|nr:hypothetical protein [Accumulibacter sp.]MBK8113221.1 hypothetical protein [Accumulibacter sp.]